MERNGRAANADTEKTGPLRVDSHDALSGSSHTITSPWCDPPVGMGGWVVESGWVGLSRHNSLTFLW